VTQPAPIKPTFSITGSPLFVSTAFVVIIDSFQPIDNGSGVNPHFQAIFRPSG
jgi:hypothetical protein